MTTSHSFKSLRGYIDASIYIYTYSIEKMVNSRKNGPRNINILFVDYVMRSISDINHKIPETYRVYIDSHLDSSVVRKLHLLYIIHVKYSTNKMVNVIPFIDVY